MVDGINTNSVASQAAPRVVRDTAATKSNEGGTAADNTKSIPAQESNPDQSNTIKNLLEQDDVKTSDFISRAEDILNKALSLKNTRLSIDIDEKSGIFIYKGIDKETGEVVSQFPAEEILALIGQYKEPEGIVVDEQA